MMSEAGHLKGDFCYCFLWLNIFYAVNAARVTTYNWENSKPLASRDAISRHHRIRCHGQKPNLRSPTKS